MGNNSMIIETRYRDIPWKEVAKCLTPQGRREQSGEVWKARGRGKPVSVITPPVVAEPPQFSVACKGPHYQIHDPKFAKPGVIKIACIHIVEMGD